jgi:phenylalanyl-tRNA synthetase beta chain
VRKTAQALKLWTDASSRFQNKLPPALVAYGMRDALALITEIAGGEVVGVVDVYPEPVETPSVSVTVAHVNSLLGSSFSRGDIEQALARLDFSYTLVEDSITVLPSFERRDICIAEDLIEEIGRTIGYEHIAGAVLPLMKTAPDQARFRGIEAIRDFLVERGFTEVSTQSFTKDGDIELANPLQSERPYLRASLLPALEDALGRAVLVAPRVLGPSRFVKLFEVGNVFTRHGEMLVVSMGVHDASGTSASEALKENVATLEQELLRIPASARYSLDGSMMELNLDQVNLEKLGDTYAPVTTRLASYRPYSIYPCALRDVAVWTPEGTEESEVVSTILKEAGEFLARVDLFDRFEKEGRISYAFRLVFESLERTLSDTDLDPAMARVAASLNEKEGWQVR